MLTFKQLLKRTHHLFIIINFERDHYNHRTDVDLTDS